MEWLINYLHRVRDDMSRGQFKLLPENLLVPIAIAIIVVLLTLVIYLIVKPDSPADTYGFSKEDEIEDEDLRRKFEDELKPIEEIESK